MRCTWVALLKESNLNRNQGIVQALGAAVAALPWLAMAATGSAVPANKPSVPPFSVLQVAPGKAPIATPPALPTAVQTPTITATGVPVAPLPTKIQTDTIHAVGLPGLPTQIKTPTITATGIAPLPANITTPPINATGKLK